MNLQRSETSEMKSGKTITIATFAMVIFLAQRTLLVISSIVESYQRGIPVSLKRIFITGYSHWDSSYYLAISEHGYTSLKEAAFWPMYPLVIRLVHLITGQSFMICGIAISLMCFFTALCFFGLLVNRNFDFRTSVVAMMMYAFFPTSYYFDAIYPEALFMTFLIGATYFANTGRFKWANTFAALASLTRNTGMLVCLIVFAEYVQHKGIGWRFWKAEWWSNLGFPVVYIALAPASLLIYCLWLLHRFGRFFAFMDAEKFWNRKFMAPWAAISGNIHMYLKPHITTRLQQYTLFEVEILFFILLTLLVALLVLRRSISAWSWWVYSVSVTLIISSDPAMAKIPDYLMSVPRFALMLFPCFIFLAKVTRGRWRINLCIIAVFVSFLFIKNGMFYTGRWIA